MRYSSDRKEQTHRRIVESASRQFRAGGIDAVGVAPLMKALDLTHGGFYAHFADKEALVGEAVRFALEESGTQIRESLETGGVPAMLELYLGEGHRTHPEHGCPLPTLAAEVARRPGPTRETFSEGVGELVEAIADHLSGESPLRRRADAEAMLAAMAGAVALARAVSDPDLGRSILESIRALLLRVAEVA